MVKISAKFCITFAGPVGSSKTPIAHFLSTKLNFPIYSNDVIRTEVAEDMGIMDREKYTKRRNTRIQSILKSSQSFILDASVDREWKNVKRLLQKNGYRWFIISLDLSKSFLAKLYKAKEYKKYGDALKRIDQLLHEHGNFVREYTEDINLHITDRQFPKRLALSYRKAKQ